MRILNMISLLLLIGTSAAQASKCGEFVYNKKGMLRKYEYLPNGPTVNTKKHGMSTTSAVSTEATTAVSDPGVTTGATISDMQFTSSRDDCQPSWDLFFGSNREDYESYVAQNLHQIKKEISVGQGGHLDMIARVHNCDEKTFESAAQKKIETFVDVDSENVFVDRLNELAAQNCPSARLVQK